MRGVVFPLEFRVKIGTLKIGTSLYSEKLFPSFNFSLISDKFSEIGKFQLLKLQLDDKHEKTLFQWLIYIPIARRQNHLSPLQCLKMFASKLFFSRKTSQLYIA